MRSLTGAFLTILFVNAAAVVLRNQQKEGLISQHGTGYRVSMPPNCNEPHPDDLYRPIRAVAREHPGADMNCYYHWYADYLGTPRNFANLLVSTAKQYSNAENTGPAAQFHLSNGEVLRSHIDPNWGLYPYDDSMCYLMGWLKGQRLDGDMLKLTNETAWLDVTERECARLPLMFNESIRNEYFDPDSKYMSIGYMADDNLRICEASQCQQQPYGADCSRATLLDYAVHLYPKCLLGDSANPNRLTGAAGQVAWCFARGCVDPDTNEIRHGNACWPFGIPEALVHAATTPPF
jgi:hypothetical protein